MSSQSRAEEDLPGLTDELLARWPDERLKLLSIWRVLQFRREHRQLFEGSYLPLVAEGERKGNVCALARATAGQWALCVVPRLAVAGLARVGSDRQRRRRTGLTSRLAAGRLVAARHVAAAAARGAAALAARHHRRGSSKHRARRMVAKRSI